MISRLIRGYELIFMLCFVATLTSGQEPQHSDKQEQCKRYNIPEITWTCKRAQDCMWSENILRTQNEHRCGNETEKNQICCPERRTILRKNSTSKPPTLSRPRKDYIQIARKKCDEYPKTVDVKCGPTNTDSNRTSYDGEGTETREYPHMALVGSGSDVANIVWSCSGSLISLRFILSAAHCSNEGTPQRIRWAAFGLLSPKEETLENLNKTVFEIVKIYNHPRYSAPYANHDIALYELENPLKLSSSVRPICLNTDESIPQEGIDIGIVTGWHFNETDSDVVEKLQKAELAFQVNDLCDRRYSSEQYLEKGFDAATMVCAGDPNDYNSTCFGDSGGPIQIKQYKECTYSYLQVGISSLGTANCRNGTLAIYTRVFAYLDWIGNIMWPNEI